MEEVQQNVLINAIKKRHEVSFVYDSGDGDKRGKKERIVVQPVCYGLTKAGNPCFRAYQINGSSESAEKSEGKIPGWRLFLLDRVVNNTWKDSGHVFKKPPFYNENGDKTMQEVLVMADFEGSASRYERGGLKKYNDERHRKNVENNPLYDFEKQVNKKIMAPDYVLRNIANTQKSPEEQERIWRMASQRGNERSIADMSRQKKFGDEESAQTAGPKMKGSDEELVSKRSKMDYSFAKENGPKYKEQSNTDNNREEENEYEDGYEQHPVEGPEANA